MQHEPLPHVPVPCLPLQDEMHSKPVSHHRLFPLSLPLSGMLSRQQEK